MFNRHIVALILLTPAVSRADLIPIVNSSFETVSRPLEVGEQTNGSGGVGVQVATRYPFGPGASWANPVEVPGWRTRLTAPDSLSFIYAGTHLFDKVPTALAFRKVHQWARLKGEFQKRTSFALFASLALHLKPRQDHAETFRHTLPLIEKAADDDRNFVKKGVSWALRGVGRRTPALLAESLELATRLATSPTPSAAWIGRDAFKDLTKLGKAKKGAKRT